MTEENQQLSMPVEQVTGNILRYATILYDGMKERADQYTEGTFVYHGKVTELFKELGIPQMYYSRIRRFLIHSDCIRMVKRGARGLGSEVQLLRRPEPSDESAEIVKLSLNRLTVPSDPATVRPEFERRIGRLEKWRETLGGLNIAEAMRNFELRISKLETELQDTKIRLEQKSKH